MKVSSLAIAWTTGIAIFSMFFGSGNVVFPLDLGRQTGSLVGFGVAGLLLSAIGAPIVGLLGAVLFEGDCKQFFYRLGKIPGYLAVMLIILLIGPFGVMPRCFVVAFGAMQPYFPDMGLWLFSILAGLFTLAMLAKRDWILPLLGYVLSPLLILSLVVIIVVGFIKDSSIAEPTLTYSQAMLKGLVTGYDTMDLLAAIFFAVSIWLLLKEKLQITSDTEIRAQLIPVYIVASLIGGGLLALIYIGLCVVTAMHGNLLQNVPSEALLSTLAIELLGGQLALVANLGIALACFTTVMALAVTVVDVIHVEFNQTSFAKKFELPYNWMVFIVVALTVALSNLGFQTIMIFLHSIMVVCYPAIIVLTLCNILYKLYGFTYVKLPVYLTFLATLGYQLWTAWL